MALIRGTDGQISCPETAVNNYQYIPRSTPERRRFHLYSGGSLKLGKPLIAANMLHVSARRVYYQADSVVQ
jgi:hypothetical protein